MGPLALLAWLVTATAAAQGDRTADFTKLTVEELKAGICGSLSEVVGTPLNEYACGDLAQLVETIDKVPAWDENTDNRFTSKTRHAAAWNSIRCETRLAEGDTLYLLGDDSDIALARRHLSGS